MHSFPGSSGGKAEQSTQHSLNLEFNFRNLYEEKRQIFRQIGDQTPASLRPSLDVTCARDSEVDGS